MQTTEHAEVNIRTTPEVRKLLMTIADAATALARLLPDKELEQGFEFPWGHSNLFPGRTASYTHFPTLNCFIP